ncbi:nucleotidyl transferase AbiEii/AbiGii toxin family protein [Glycomyces xiaoerkulensis]|uniref:nucleotidyl transferase AbiEii/AbiGii toxin family protein n=1 Tax=Glycomyces xiaoerkulensis TaxID=2038139 RepID=UPI00130000E3|nr:nucleotidyl transferase AbiEii/AbiGii toxin family protein [Glycomyces xiaoerkulensis]
MAIKDAAKRANRDDKSVSVDARIRQAYFDRFLCRVFSEGDRSEWVLKGGTGMLARIPNARVTLDIDLCRSGFSLDQALEDLKRLAAIDLGDHFRFVYRDHNPIAAGESQPYTDGYRVIFETYIGVKKSTPIRVDLVTGVRLTGAVTIAPPSNRVMVRDLIEHDYRLYPIADQIADKVCATMATYRGDPSSREKDLIDLVVIAKTQAPDAVELRDAIELERRRRRLDPFDRFGVPENWGPVYAKLAKGIPHCAAQKDLPQAMELMHAFLDPVITGTVDGRWNQTAQYWEGSEQ